MISVIIPMYNSAATIARALDSVLAQDYPAPPQIIVVDDGSTDRGPQIVAQYAAAHPQIEFIQQSNGGAAAARNTGLVAARGDLIAFLDSDDHWLPGKIAFQARYMADHPEVDLIGGIYGDDDPTGGSLQRLGPATRIDIRSQVMKNYFAPPTVIFRRTMLDRTGLFNPRLRHAEEGWFFNRATFHCNCVLIRRRVAAPVIPKARWGDSGLSGDLWAMERGELVNIAEARRSRMISAPLMAVACAFSIAKFARRWIISKTRRSWPRAKR